MYGTHVCMRPALLSLISAMLVVINQLADKMDIYSIDRSSMVNVEQKINIYKTLKNYICQIVILNNDLV